MASVQEMKDELQALIERVSDLADKVETTTHLDPVNVAAQLGRLDFVSALIAIVGVALVLGGLFAFGFFRGEATAIAKRAAEDIAERRLTDLLASIEKRLDDYDSIAKKRKQPTSTPSTSGAAKATSAGEFKDGKE